MGLRIEASVYCHIGRRPNNEDNFYVNGSYMERKQMNKGGKLHKIYTTDEQMYAVCDGMGGAEFGEEASLRAVRALKVYQDKNIQLDNTSNLNEMISKASLDIDEISLSKGMPSGSSGSTIAMLIMKDWYYRAVHVGDSRVYLLRDGVLKRITKDDSLVQEMVDRGEITLDEAWSHPRKNVITRHLGMPMEGQPLHPTIGRRSDMKPGDRFMICSDGLSDALHDSVICEIMNAEKGTEEAATQLARSALADMDNAEIPSDNITVIVLDVLGLGAKDSDVRRARKWALLRILAAAATAASGCGLLLSAINLIKLLM
ncbi:MAG: PP2C family protein-serine/threonine phosphatase [bacterium]